MWLSSLVKQAFALFCSQVPGFSKKNEKEWLYSSKVEHILHDYTAR